MDERLTENQFATDRVGFDEEVDDETLRVERAKGRELAKTQWWKNLRGRGVCHYCKQRFPAKELTMDHQVPLIRGGKSTKSNVVPCCKTCNSQKKYLLPSEWQDYLERLAKENPAG